MIAAIVILAALLACAAVVIVVLAVIASAEAAEARDLAEKLTNAERQLAKLHAGNALGQDVAADGGPRISPVAELVAATEPDLTPDDRALIDWIRALPTAGRGVPYVPGPDWRVLNTKNSPENGASNEKGDQ